MKVMTKNGWILKQNSFILNVTYYIPSGNFIASGRQSPRQRLPGAAAAAEGAGQRSPAVACGQRPGPQLPRGRSRRRQQGRVAVGDFMATPSGKRSASSPGSGPQAASSGTARTCAGWGGRRETWEARCGAWGASPAAGGARWGLRSISCGLRGASRAWGESPAAWGARCGLRSVSCGLRGALWSLRSISCSLRSALGPEECLLRPDGSAVVWAGLETDQGAHSTAARPDGTAQAPWQELLVKTVRVISLPGYAWGAMLPLVLLEALLKVETWVSVSCRGRPSHHQASCYSSRAPLPWAQNPHCALGPKAQEQPHHGAVRQPHR